MTATSELSAHDTQRAYARAAGLLYLLVLAFDIAGQIASGSRNIFGLMVESHLTGGAQKFTPGKDDPQNLEYGKSITDACIGLPESLDVLETLSQAVRQRREK